MTAPILTPFDIAAALPDVDIHVTEWQPMPSSAAWVLTGEPDGEMVLIHEYYGPTDPRPLLCMTHGLQRHDYDAKRERFVCKLCSGRSNDRLQPRR